MEVVDLNGERQDPYLNIHKNFVKNDLVHIF